MDKEKWFNEKNGSRHLHNIFRVFTFFSLLNTLCLNTDCSFLFKRLCFQFTFNSALNKMLATLMMISYWPRPCDFIKTEKRREVQTPWREFLADCESNYSVQLKQKLNFRLDFIFKHHQRHRKLYTHIAELDGEKNQLFHFPFIPEGFRQRWRHIYGFINELNEGRHIETRINILELELCL